MATLTVEDARRYARDYESSDEEIAELVAAADAYLVKAVGEGLDPTDPTVRYLCGQFVADFADNRGTESSGSFATAPARRRVVDSMILQLRMELAAGKREQNG